MPPTPPPPPLRGGHNYLYQHQQQQRHHDRDDEHDTDHDNSDVYGYGYGYAGNGLGLGMGRPLQRTRDMNIDMAAESSPGVVLTPTQMPVSMQMQMQMQMAEQSQGFYTPEGVNGYGEEEEEDEEEGEGFVQEGEEEEDDDEEFEGEGLGEEEDEDEDDGIGDGEGGEGDGEGEEEHGGEGVEVMDIDPHFDPTALGLKEIGNLASWTVSSCKPGCGVEALRDENTDLFWQSDGPQPHHINIHFSRFVAIRAIRLFLNFDDDESYTPTRIVFLAGTGYHDLITFDELSFSQPKGWIDARLGKVGGGEDGKTLRAFLVQIKIVENHQNGKDTHVRGLKIYAKDERAGDVGGLEMLGDRELVIRSAADAGRKSERKHVEEPGLTVPDWMGEPELR